jgi:hypothetical protein
MRPIIATCGIVLSAVLLVSGAGAYGADLTREQRAKIEQRL